MRADLVVIGRDYRLRYAPAGHYRVKAMGWATAYGLDGKARKRLTVQAVHQDTGHDLPGADRQCIAPAELAGPWDDVVERRKTERRMAQGSAVVALRDAFASTHLDAVVAAKRGSGDRVVIELSPADGETLARLIETDRAH